VRGHPARLAGRGHEWRQVRVSQQLVQRGRSRLNARRGKHGPERAGNPGQPCAAHQGRGGRAPVGLQAGVGLRGLACLVTGLVRVFVDERDQPRQGDGWDNFHGFDSNWGRSAAKNSPTFGLARLTVLMLLGVVFQFFGLVSDITAGWTAAALRAKVLARPGAMRAMALVSGGVLTLLAVLVGIDAIRSLTRM
jgi:hypothetical protein